MMKSGAASFRHLIDETNCKGIAIELPLARFHGRDDNQHGVQYPEGDQNRNANEHDAKNRGDRIVNQHRDLKVERFFSMCVDLRRVAAFHEPNDQRSPNMAQDVKKQSE